MATRARTVSALGEVGLIRRLVRKTARPAWVETGIGDDTAVLRLSAADRRHSVRWLFASDMLIEGVHFRLPRGAGRRQAAGVVPPEWVGWKALACNVSDVAAMGGVPRAAVVSVGLPPGTPLRVADAIGAGLRRCARRFGVALVGGDTVRAPLVVIDVAILGVADARRVALRSAAEPGDAVFVTGRLGRSLQTGRHARFIPRVAEAQWLVRHVPVHAMMDLSDGLASDAWQLARASRVRVRLDEARIPRAPSATAQEALMDGEDFELLLTVPARASRRMPRRIGRVPVTHIGMVTGRGAGVELVCRDGRVVPLQPQGFTHFHDASRPGVRPPGGLTPIMLSDD